MHNSTTTSQYTPIKIWLGVIVFFTTSLLMLNPLIRLLNIDIDFNQAVSFIPPITSIQWQNLYDVYFTLSIDGFSDATVEFSLFKKLYLLQYFHVLLYGGFFINLFMPIAYFKLKKSMPNGFIIHSKFLGIIGVVFGIGLGLFKYTPSLSDSLYFIPFEILLLTTLYGYIIWRLLFLSNVVQTKTELAKDLKKAIFSSVHIMGIALIIGTFVASLNAGFMYNDFPLMAGEFVPSNYFELSPVILNLFENHASVQFNHRIFAYATAISTAWVYKKQKNTVCPLVKKALRLWYAVIIAQILLGIATLVSSVQLHTAMSHQFMMILSVSVGIYLMYVSKTRKYNK